MQQEGIGVDCSGFVAHLLDTLLRVEKKGSLSSNIILPKTNLFRRISALIRPIENINAKLLTNEQNTVKIEAEDVRTGDLLRLKGLKHGHHIALVVDTRTGKNGKKEIEYVHSTRYYGDENGVRRGIIKLQNGKEEWLEKDKKGICWTLKQFEKDKEDNGFRRPKFFLEK